MCPKAQRTAAALLLMPTHASTPALRLCCCCALRCRLRQEAVALVLDGPQRGSPQPRHPAAAVALDGDCRCCSPRSNLLGGGVGPGSEQPGSSRSRACLMSEANVTQGTEGAGARMGTVCTATTTLAVVAAHRCVLAASTASTSTAAAHSIAPRVASILSQQV